MDAGFEPKRNTHLNTSQIDTVFDTMSDGVMTLRTDGTITYANLSFHHIFRLSENTDLTGKSFEHIFLKNKKNKTFQKFYDALMEGTLEREETHLSYYTADGEKISLLIQITARNPHSPSSEIMLLVKDRSVHITLKQRDRDCAFIFSGLIICITLYLMTWSCIRFTLNIHLRTAVYTVMIETIAFFLFLEIIFLTSFSLKDLGLLPNSRTFLKNLKETIFVIIIYSLIMVLLNSILFLTGNNVKSRFIGGSPAGALNYLMTAFIQEFLARGVIQNCIKVLVKIKYQKFFCVLLTSLLFSLMHMPFGFIFMMGAFLLSLILGYIYERQKNLWGCFLLHWTCGYLTMCMFF
ncbi:MAG: CPBP family intramembrane metalloprotease [Lachnospiraceae bacterium]|nr:CPBP family intramembrane metalloprotease [Lachnospiraceae bacterium]